MLEAPRQVTPFFLQSKITFFWFVCGFLLVVLAKKQKFHKKKSGASNILIAQKNVIKKNKA